MCILFLSCLIVYINVCVHFVSFIITQFPLYVVCTSVLCYRYGFIHVYLYVLYFVVAMIFVEYFTVQWTWAFNTDPEGLMYLVSNPPAHKYESFCGMNTNNCLIISILLPISSRGIWEQKSRARYVGVLHMSIL
jgi:hypothetical protein